MIELVNIDQNNIKIHTLEEQSKYSILESPIKDLLETAKKNHHTIYPNGVAEDTNGSSGRTIWMINSTSKGGGVAEIMIRLIPMFKEVGYHNTKWAVINTDKQKFFNLTKKIHNLIHGSAPSNGVITFDEEEREIFELVNHENGKHLCTMVKPHDIVVIHDPQPIAMVKELRKKFGQSILCVWRCHIGLDTVTKETESAWEFLKPYFQFYDHCIFSAPEYIPSMLKNKTSIITPSIAPLTPKNEPLSLLETVDILSRSDLIENPVFSSLEKELYKYRVLRLQPDGSNQSPLKHLKSKNAKNEKYYDQNGHISNEIGVGFLFRPIITQISRWDKLKGFEPLINAFVHLKKNIEKYAKNETHRHTLKRVRLVLGGPDPKAIQDDPEGTEVFNQLKKVFCSLPFEIQRDIAILSLPMENLKQNALIVNAIQSSSLIIVQNSIREGFGLTATEAMWKSKCLLCGPACGLKQQVEEGIEGKFFKNSEDVVNIADVLSETLSDIELCRRMGVNGQKRVVNNFLVFNHLSSYIDLFANLLKDRKEV